MVWWATCSREVKMKYNATGELFDTESENNTPTIPVATEAMQITSIEGKYTQRHQKLFIILIHAIWDELESSKLMHEVSVEDVSRLFREITGSKNQEWIWDYCKQLQKIKITYESPKLESITSILGTVERHRDRGIVEFEVPAGMKKLLAEPNTFGRLRTHFLIGLNGKYSVSLYQYLETKINLQTPVIDCDLEELKGWLGVNNKSYSKWFNFETRVLKPAVKEVNENPIVGKFLVSYEPLKGQKRKIKAIRFLSF